MAITEDPVRSLRAVIASLIRERVAMLFDVAMKVLSIRSAKVLCVFGTRCALARPSWGRRAGYVRRISTKFYLRNKEISCQFLIIQSCGTYFLSIKRDHYVMNRHLEWSASSRKKYP